MLMHVMYLKPHIELQVDGGGGTQQRCWARKPDACSSLSLWRFNQMWLTVNKRLGGQMEFTASLRTDAALVISSLYNCLSAPRQVGRRTAETCSAAFLQCRIVMRETILSASPLTEVVFQLLPCSLAGTTTGVDVIVVCRRPSSVALYTCTQTQCWHVISVC